MVLIGGEITTSTYVDFQEIVRDVAKNIGYTNPDFGLGLQIDGDSEHNSLPSLPIYRWVLPKVRVYIKNRAQAIRV